jgi:hypothetical protein
MPSIITPTETGRDKEFKNEKHSHRNIAIAWTSRSPSYSSLWAKRFDTDLIQDITSKTIHKVKAERTSQVSNT